MNFNKDVEQLCKKNYDMDTMAHAYRVELLLKMSPHFKHNLSEPTQRFAQALALCHDLFEDTSVSRVFTDFSSALYNSHFQSLDLDQLTFAFDLWHCIFSITHDANKESYPAYISRIRQEANLKNRLGYIVYLVKIADICDHFTQKDTLTDELKEKYINALPFLL